MKNTVLVSTLSWFIAAAFANAAFAADCPDLNGRYSLDATPTASSTFLVITQTGCTQIDMTWFLGPTKSTEYLRPVDGQTHSYGIREGFALTERWSWKNGTALESEQEYNDPSQSEDDIEDALYSLDSAGNLSETAGEIVNGEATESGSGTYYRVK
jgi:hypothetical protein